MHEKSGQIYFTLKSFLGKKKASNRERERPVTVRERKRVRESHQPSERERSVTWTWDRWHSCLGRAPHYRSSKDQLHPSLITDPQTPKTHRSDRQSCTDEYRLSSNLDNQLQAVLQHRRHLDRSLASHSHHHHPRPISFLTHPRPISSPPLKTNLSFPIYLYFPHSLNICLFDLWFFFFFSFCFGGVLVVFVLWGGGFSVGAGGFSNIKFVWKLRKWLRKCEKFVGKYHFQNVTKH